MATKSVPRVNGVQPGDGNIDAASQDMPALQDLWKAIHAISREDGFGRFAQLVERVDSQEADLKDKDGKINALESQLAACEASHRASNKELFDKFEERHQQWSDKNEVLRSGVAALNTASEEKDKSIEALRGELKRTQAQVVDLEKAYGAEKKSVKIKNVQIAELDAQRKTAVNEANDLKARLKKAEDNAIALNRSLQEEANEKQKHLSDAVEANKKIEKYKGFTVKIESLDLPAVRSQLEALWESVSALILGYIGCNLPDINDWSKLNDNKVFKNRIPLPQNNSKIAKEMRVAVVLGALANLMVQFLFQPTYVLGERGGLRQLLRYQATVDPLKEMYARGIILSMKHDYQDEIDQEKIDKIIDDLRDVVRVDILFDTKDDLENFCEALDDLLLQFQDLWKKIQRGKEKLEPSFEERPSAAKYPWYIVGLPAAVETQKRSSSPPATTDAQDDTIIVPQIVQMRTKGDPEPVTHGWVLQKTQIHAADEEIRRISRGLRITPFGEEDTGRPRTRTRRAPSISGNASPDQKKGSPFLPRSSAAQDA
ncbi:MEI5 protein [Paraphaeosphaeria sporulosa]